MYVCTHLFETGHEVLGYFNVPEHALQLAGELSATLLLQFEQHRLLGIGRSTFTDKKPLRKVFLVESLKHILTCQNKSTETHTQVGLNGNGNEKRQLL